jgi:hypothetical protein
MTLESVVEQVSVSVSEFEELEARLKLEEEGFTLGSYLF